MHLAEMLTTPILGCSARKKANRAHISGHANFAWQAWGIMAVRHRGGVRLHVGAVFSGVLSGS